MAEFRDKIKAYADKNWMVPCEDKTAWTYYTAINTTQEMVKRGLSPGEWSAIFLLYDGQKNGTAWKLEGLFLVKTANVPLAKSRNLEATAFAERIMISSWFDNQGDENLTITPPYHGLNDCAHFVTECLAAGGIDVRTPSVPVLLNSLRGLSDTKTLALTVLASAAERILKAKILKPGDVIIYSKTATSHGHSVIYLDNEKIAMHTKANHPDHPTDGGNWKDSASPDHPLVTLLHFGRDDPAPSALSLMPGWWKVTWRNTPYYYLFDAKGGVSYSKREPTGAKQPMMAADGRGYWFESANKVKICWTSTGSLEELSVRPPMLETHMEGTWNGTEKLVADKMF
jgi:hypothetical protein